MCISDHDWKKATAWVTEPELMRSVLGWRASLYSWSVSSSDFLGLTSGELQESHVFCSLFPLQVEWASYSVSSGCKIKLISFFFVGLVLLCCSGFVCLGLSARLALTLRSSCFFFQMWGVQELPTLETFPSSHPSCLRAT